MLARMTKASAEIDGRTVEIRKQNIGTFALFLSRAFRRLAPETRIQIGKQAAKKCVLVVAAAWAAAP